MGGVILMTTENMGTPFCETNCPIEKIIRLIPNEELWLEIVRRLGVKFGKIQMIIHAGKPSRFASIESRIETSGRERA